MEKTIKSTLTGGDAGLTEVIPVKKIIEEYDKSPGIDVGKYFKNVDEVGIYQCMDSGFRFYYPDFIFADAKFYEQLQKSDFYYQEWTWEHENAFRSLIPDNKVLEVGCGTGSFINKLQENGFDCTGLEINEDAIRVCRQKGLRVYNESLEIHADQHSGTYDAVCSFQVLEHIYDVKSYITACITCLKPGGKLIFAVPNNNPYLFKYDKYHAMNLPPHHSGLWNKNSFKKLATFFPLKVETIKFEPLYNRSYFLKIYLEHFRLKKAADLVSKISPRVSNTLLWPLKLFVKGRSMLAVFTRC